MGSTNITCHRCQLVYHFVGQPGILGMIVDVKRSEIAIYIALSQSGLYKPHIQKDTYRKSEEHPLTTLSTTHAGITYTVQLGARDKHTAKRFEVGLALLLC